MKHILFHTNSNNQYDIAILIKETAFIKSNIEINYVTPLIKQGIAPDSIIALNLKYNDQGKAPVKLIKEYLKTILKACVQLGTKTLLVADAGYFKTLTKSRITEPHFGYILPCKIQNYEHINVILSVNYQALFYNPTLQNKLDISINTVVSHTQGTHINLGQGIIKYAEYPKSRQEIISCLKKLMKYPVLTCDIETKSLNFSEAGIATMAFAWSQHEGCAFAVDRGASSEVKQLLFEFFQEYTGKLIYHGGTYDIKVIIYELFMNDLQDEHGLHIGLHTMYHNIDDTKLITYLATNTTAGNVLGLKPNAFEFAGNYAKEEIKDTTLILLPDLLEYNLVDCLATWYVYNKNYPIMLRDQQKDIYDTIFIPSMRLITHMELVGMPMDAVTIDKKYQSMATILNTHIYTLRASPLIKNYEWRMQREAMIVANLLLKKKVRPIEDFKKAFNPNSNKQVQALLYEDLNFDVIDKTDTGQPAVGGKTLKKLLNNLILEHNLTEEDLK